ncbi:N-acetylmuramoyl-L-alanine amidase [Mumia flava]|uniref:N-acetylmuramoyl-L-alanine amidase n=1 Tax=Mumia flava TaxID=1348852 RepID=A0A0B2BP98_9ACTN|nr:N-acetylmuramoyl-L-alanine amidase [Mumia flava]PJJ57007.1 N-acetylmuramoyl-L-alanine amidase [Mumia flava]
MDRRRIALLAAASLLVAVPTSAEARPVAGGGVDPDARAGPLAGRVIVIDPGHQLGNARHPAQINQLVPAGGFRKACNTTGTATNAGWPEATFVFRVAKRLRARLRDLGARVVMTRTRNSLKLWGPCVDVRGKLGNRGFRGRARPADAKVSIHADGSTSGGRGFHVIVSTKRHRASGTVGFGRDVRRALAQRGFRKANYIAGGDGFDIRGDLATLNLSRIPTVMVELGNMRNRREAKVMHSKRGQKRYARALAAGVRRSLLG